MSDARVPSTPVPGAPVRRPPAPGAPPPEDRGPAGAGVGHGVGGAPGTPLAGAARPPRALGRINPRGIATLLKREMMVYVRFWPMSIGGPVLMTALYLAVFSLALGPQRATEEGARVLPFIAPGLVALAVLQRAAETCTFSIMIKKMEGGLTDILCAPLSAGEVVGAYVAAGAIAGLGTGSAVAAVVLGWTGAGLAHPLLALAFMLGAGAMMAAFGVIVGIWAKKWDHVAAVYGFVILPIAFMSGIFAPVDALPAPFDALVRLNPLYYLIDGLRASVLGFDRATTSPWLALGVVLALNAALILAAVRLLASGYRIKG